MSHRLPATAGMAPFDVMVVALNFVSLSSPSSLANYCTFLVGIWRNIGNLVQFALATVLGRRRRVLFLVRLKNRRDFSPNSLFFNYNAHDSGGILLSKKRGNLELPKSSKANGCGECSSQGTLYRRRNLGKLTTHRVQGKNVKQNKFHSVPKGAFNLQIRVAS